MICASKPGNYIAGATAPSTIMSYSELKFIQAEAYLKLGQTAPAQAAYEAAVAASVLKVTGLPNTAWLAANINGVTVTTNLIADSKIYCNFRNEPGFC